MNPTTTQLRKKANWLLTGLQEHPEIADCYTVTLNFSGYSSLYATVNDIKKLCTVAMLTEPPYISPIVGNPNIDIANILELAIQLMPKSEPEFLDEIKEILKQPEPQPLYNCSTSKIIDAFPDTIVIQT